MVKGKHQLAWMHVLRRCTELNWPKTPCKIHVKDFACLVHRATAYRWVQELKDKAPRMSVCCSFTLSFRERPAYVALCINSPGDWTKESVIMAVWRLQASHVYWPSSMVPWGQSLRRSKAQCAELSTPRRLIEAFERPSHEDRHRNRTAPRPLDRNTPRSTKFPESALFLYR